MIRRHPDIKLLRNPAQLAGLEETQRRILNSIWPLLKPGGKLLYVTCSVLKQEGEERIEEFLQSHPGAIPEPLCADTAVTLPCGSQLLPGMGETDGFYYSRLSKAG